MTTNTITTTGAPPALALGLGRSRRLVAVADHAEASRVYRAACDANMARTGKGTSAMPEGLLYDTTGPTPRLVARISWNGKVWANKPWAPGDEPLFNPYVADAIGGAR